MSLSLRSLRPPTWARDALSRKQANLRGDFTPEEEEVWGKGRVSYLQGLHVLINPGGLFLQTGDGVFGPHQSTVDPALRKNGRQFRGCMEALFAPSFCPGTMCVLGQGWQLLDS